MDENTGSTDRTKAGVEVDLHLHTTASDGSATPRQVVREAERRGIRVLAIADHDSVGGVKEAMQAGDARINDDGALPKRFKGPVMEAGR
jgi:histidinol phosphatase-like PHP family hydrolase